MNSNTHHGILKFHMYYVYRWEPLFLNFLHKVEFLRHWCISINVVKCIAISQKQLKRFIWFISIMGTSSNRSLLGQPWVIRSRVTLYTAGHLHTAVPHCWHSRAPIVPTAVSRENNEHGCVYLQGCVQAVRLCRGSPVKMMGIDNKIRIQCGRKCFATTLC